MPRSATLRDAVTVERVDERLLQQRRGSPVSLQSEANDTAERERRRRRPAPIRGSASRSSPGRGRPLRDGRVGEVVLETPSRMREYLGHSRGTRRALRGRSPAHRGPRIPAGRRALLGRAPPRAHHTPRSEARPERLRARPRSRCRACARVASSPSASTTRNRGPQRVVVAVEIRDPTLDPVEPSRPLSAARFTRSSA